ncbi:nuclear transport factor 2 family protein [Pontivivens ytuae]|uniref:Nuclear transport factor 2 family protein n=1 Tax=Pontivivens ytuae TaxID=2789856 RepID=A0A7S9LNT0_9RHOB|nr:nuclear transport factor 2 family protein [Pontivivens ytuae]QPH52517.1 nuclear transport factor 2 family protein [Pontivivens ytuae]
MEEEHPNVALLSRLDLRDLAGAADLFSEDFVWHYFNPALPDVHGDYLGVEGLRTFFGKIADMSDGTFRIAPVSAMPMGDELVVVHVRNTMVSQGQSTALDAVVVWRVVDGRFAEAWDIPAINTMAVTAGADGLQ